MSESTDSTAVKRALRALATGETARQVDPNATPSEWSETVRQATTALERLDTAAAFVDEGGLVRLRAAVEGAEQGERHETARRGQRALATVERFRRAAAGEE